MANIDQQISEFKNKLKQSHVIGPFCKSLEATYIEIIGYSGFDFCILDMEHGPVTTHNLQDLIRACNVSNVLPIVRVSEISEEAIGKVLDLGAAGIQVPQISHKKAAQQAIQYAKFAPIGERGVCRFVRAADYSMMDRFEYFKKANECLVILQVEGQEGIDNIDDILSVEGLDILFIGPYDLSQSLGVAGQIMHKKVVEQMKYIIEKAKERDVIIGTFVDTIENALYWDSIGVKYLSYSVDVGIFASACQSIIEAML